MINGELKNTKASGWYPIASHMINVSLAIGEEKEFIFVLGYIENEKDEKFESLNVINKKKAERNMQLLKRMNEIYAENELPLFGSRKSLAVLMQRKLLSMEYPVWMLLALRGILYILFMNMQCLSRWLLRLRELQL